MFDISDKFKSKREAVAFGKIKTTKNVIGLIKEGKIEKGNVLEVARIAGIMAAKKTSEIIPLCHPIPIDFISIDFKLNDDEIEIKSIARTIWKTGIEMEAMTAVTISALTIYDMIKPLEEPVEISEIKLVEKKGGKSSFLEKFEGKLKLCILVVSDSTYKGTREDKAGKIIKEILKDYEIEIFDYSVLPDDKERIKEYLKIWSSKNANLILTIGGTGLGPKDLTVEATKEVVEKEVLGISEAMRSFGQERTPYAMLSRGICGILGKTVILNLPGSSKGAKESIMAILPGIFHIFKMIEGGGHKE